LLVKFGDLVGTDQDLMEVETSKATMNVASPCPGRVEKLSIKLNESYPVGTVLGYLEASAEDAARLGLDTPPQDKNGQQSLAASVQDTKPADGSKQMVEPTVRGLPVPANATGASYMS